MHHFGSQMPPMPSFPSSSDKDLRRPQSPPPPQQQQQQQQQQNAAAKPGAGPSKPQFNGCTDVKPRLTKDQHDILEAHFQQQNKPSTNTKKGFAENLGVPIDKINNWFQNRRAKVKQDAKKQQNQYNMNMGLYGAPPMPMASSQFLSHAEQQQPQRQQPVNQEFYPSNVDISATGLPVQNMSGPSIEMGPQLTLHQPNFDMHGLGSIPEADRTTSYTPDIMQSFLAATAGASYMQHHPASMASQESAFTYDTTGLPNTYASELSLSMPNTLPNDRAPSNEPFNGDFASFPPHINTNTPNSADAQNSAGSISSDQSALSGFSAATTQSPAGPTSSTVNSLASVFSNWTSENEGKTVFTDDGEDPFDNPYMPQTSTSDCALSSYWTSNGQQQSFSQAELYQQPNGSAQVILSSPEQSDDCKINVSQADFDNLPTFGDSAYSRRNSSTTNLASNIEAIHIQNCQSPDEFKQPNQPSSIAARRQKRPTALNSNTLRSASFTSGMSGLTSPAGNSEHTLRRIRSSGISNSGRIQKVNPGSAQRSPMALSFAEAAASPKFARTFSTSSTATIGQGGSLAPPTPQTPNEMGHFPPHWQGNAVSRNQGSMPEYSSPESLSISYSVDRPTNGNYKTSASPPSTPLDVGQWNQTRLGRDSIYRDTPPQSAPATQQSFPRPQFVPPAQMKSAFYSTSDLTIVQPKPSHFRRPSLPGTNHSQMNDPYLQQPLQLRDLYDGQFSDMSFSNISHNVPFAPSMMPDFVPYMPPHGQGSGNMLQGAPEPQQKSYIFANQGPGDFR